MTNDQLKSTLESLLTGSTDEDTIFLLLDAAIHAAIIQKKDLSGLADIFMGFVGLHQIMLLLGVPPQLAESDPLGQSLLAPSGASVSEPRLSEEENQRVDNILKGIKFEL